jgi:aminobenzoyl-glutamate transport protein
VQEVVGAMVKQVKEMAYMLVLTFFCFNFLALMTHSGAGAWITYAGVKALVAAHLESSPVLVLVAFILMSSVINLFIASLSAKWLMLGPVFIPMLYHVNSQLTPEVVLAAYRTADPCTNIVTPVMTYAGVILLYCRRYRPDFTLGELGLLMAPYAGIFLAVTTCVMLLWFKLGIPFGF